jgi:hypothetical protein
MGIDTLKIFLKYYLDYNYSIKLSYVITYLVTMTCHIITFIHTTRQNGLATSLI